MPVRGQTFKHDICADAALANPADDHTLMVFDPTLRGKTDRMALVFKKPLK